LSIREVVCPDLSGRWVSVVCGIGAYY
jgi:hypothetical protein